MYCEVLKGSNQHITNILNYEDSFFCYHNKIEELGLIENILIENQKKIMELIYWFTDLVSCYT